LPHFAERFASPPQSPLLRLSLCSLLCTSLCGQLHAMPFFLIFLFINLLSGVTYLTHYLNIKPIPRFHRDGSNTNIQRCISSPLPSSITRNTTLDYLVIMVVVQLFASISYCFRSPSLGCF
jgi:hypothetical protein